MWGRGVRSPRESAALIPVLSFRACAFWWATWVEFEAPLIFSFLLGTQRCMWWAHLGSGNGLKWGICLYFNSVGNSLVLCLLSWSLFSQTLGCLLGFVLKCAISFGDTIVGTLEFGPASFSFLFHLSSQHTFAFDFKSKCRKPGSYRKAHRHTKKTKCSYKHSI